jgi:hypothetical protein
MLSFCPVFAAFREFEHPFHFHHHHLIPESPTPQITPIEPFHPSMQQSPSKCPPAAPKATAREAIPAVRRPAQSAIPNATNPSSPSSAPPPAPPAPPAQLDTLARPLLRLQDHHARHMRPGDLAPAELGRQPARRERRVAARLRHPHSSCSSMGGWVRWRRCWWC